jgi:imidazolonepropionase-like amidohydrolase
MSMHRLALAASFLLAASASTPARVIEPGELVTAFTGVTVVTEYGGERLERHTVAVRGDRIIAIARDGRLVLPAGSRVLNRSGEFLAPGIADMHVHCDRLDEPRGCGRLSQDGRVFIANSITTVRNLSGGVSIRQRMAAIAAGEQVGPTMYSSGQLIDGPTSPWGRRFTTSTPEQLRQRVAADAAAGYMAIKLYEELSPEQFAAGVEEARAHNLQIYAHVPHSMTLDQVLAYRIDSIEHLFGFDRSLGGEGKDPPQRWPGANADRFAPLAQEVAQSGVWNAPTLILLLEWSKSRFPDNMDMVRQGHQKRLAMVRALREAKAPLLIGTDTGPAKSFEPGISIHEELRFFREAGFSPTQILRIATLDAARFLRKEGEFGRIAEGARADLLLLPSDPEQDLAVLRAPAGVMAAGRWYDRAALDEMLRAAAAPAHPPPPR